MRRIVAHIAALLIGLSPAFLFADSPGAAWQKVDAAVAKGLPKTAIEELEPIIKDSIRSKAYPEAIKAVGMKTALESQIEGAHPEEYVVRMRALLPTMPEEMHPVLETLLARGYWHYFKQNRWRIMGRTEAGGTSGEDITTWDLGRLLTEIDAQFTKALSFEPQLKRIPIGDYDALLVKGNLPDKYRPTLFDFLAFDALEFYTAGEQGAQKAEDAFELSADSPIFAKSEEFLKWKPDAADSTSPVLKGILIYQRLLAAHLNDQDKSAFIDADLWRLHFGYNLAVGEDKNSRYKAALADFADRWKGSEISARALAYQADVLRSEGAFKEAHDLAARGKSSFPRGMGAELCKNVLSQIEAKSVSIETERVWNEPLPSIDIRYRNLTKAYFRLVPYHFETFVEKTGWHGLYNFPYEALAGKKPALEWAANLAPTEDFRERVEKVAIPKRAESGFYILVASHAPDFGLNDNTIQALPVWLSDLALVVRERNAKNVTEGFVLDAKSGEPRAGAGVTIWMTDRNGAYGAGKGVTTNADGFFSIGTAASASTGYQGFLLADYKGERVSSLRPFYSWPGRKGEPKSSQTIFFTDRSLYRPGQSIYYKGICIRTDAGSANYSTLSNHSETVVFLDPNGKEISRTEKECNDFGSFDGVFTAPRDRLAGRMTIRTESQNGFASFNVEEYKRPKFQVELSAPREPAKLNAPVTLTGKATAYTGVPIADVKVHWRVERRPEFPLWCWWSSWYYQRGNQAIAHGSSRTEADGSFSITFPAKPDLSIPEKNEPIFNYTIYADVTDINGETRSSQILVRVGYRTLQATLAIAEWQTDRTPVEIRVAATSLSGTPQPAQGVVKIYGLKQPGKAARAAFHRRRGSPPFTGEASPSENPPVDPADPKTWELGQTVQQKQFATDTNGTASLSFRLPSGIYRAVLETKDAFGKAVTAQQDIQVNDPESTKYPLKIASYVAAPKWYLEPGETFSALWGTGYDKGRAFVEIESAGKNLYSGWTKAGHTQDQIRQRVTEDLRGGFTVRVTYVRENRAYLNERTVQVPWSNKQLSVRWEHFTSKLSPGQKETWTAVITHPDSKPAFAEMVAELYDASLDQFLPHYWPGTIPGFRSESIESPTRFENSLEELARIGGSWRQEIPDLNFYYRRFPPGLSSDLYWGSYRGRNEAAMDDRELMPSAEPLRKMEAVGHLSFAQQAEEVFAPAPEKRDADALKGADLDNVSARKNLAETAFFLPHLLTGKDGVVKIEFRMPDALTEWRFKGFAHDTQLRSGILTDKAVTAKDLMVEPNPPRVVREGDQIDFTVKVSNQSESAQSGTLRLTFSEAATGEPRDEALSNTTPEQSFEIPAKESRSYSWKISVPDGLGFLTYKAVGAAKELSDGEEGNLPVLSRRILVRESLPLPIRGKQTKTFEFKKLLDSAKSSTLRQENLTLQMVSQPAWYAVMALPYLMEFPYECSEQTFTRLYANALARRIAESDPKIRKVFDLWRDTPALDSPLEKNQDLKSLMLEETPWVRASSSEKEARRNVGLLFDANRLEAETPRTLKKLGETQRDDGLWPWFPGGPANEYISLYIVTGFGRLRHLGIPIDLSPAKKALPALDAWMDRHYREITDKDDYVPSYIDALYLYGRSFFLEDLKLSPQHETAVRYFLGQSRRFWLSVDSRQSQAHLALALKRFASAGFGKPADPTPSDIMKSLKERSVSSEELGMYWRDLEFSWWWYRAPIETQALMIEAFDEVMGDAEAVEDAKLWLLKQKQTQDWKTTKATADAVYALLLRGSSLLSSDALVEVSLGGQEIKPEHAEAGTGFYEQRFVRSEIKPEFGRITVKKTDDGVSWGSLHWQYLEDMEKVTPYEGTPLKLKKTLFVKTAGKGGQALTPLTGKLNVGDELVVRVELRADRDMEYVHLKDQRGSGTEPVNVLSQYKYQDGLAYYESTRDTASHFFIDYLPKGTYVFEYSTRVQLKGKYQTGVASIECMYAPEFNSHSESLGLEVG